MTATADTKDSRNVSWAQSNLGQKMLMKMGWKEGKGLGKHGQGMSDNLRAKRREEGLGIGAKTDTSGNEGFSTTSQNFHSVLQSLQATHSTTDTKKEKKQKKKLKKRKAHDAKQTNSLTLARNRVVAGHSRKMRESKDLQRKSKEDMAAIFGVKVSEYQAPSSSLPLLESCQTSENQNQTHLQNKEEQESTTAIVTTNMEADKKQRRKDKRKREKKDSDNKKKKRKKEKKKRD